MHLCMYAPIISSPALVSWQLKICVCYTGARHNQYVRKIFIIRSAVYASHWYTYNKEGYTTMRGPALTSISAAKNGLLPFLFSLFWAPFTSWFQSLQFVQLVFVIQFSKWAPPLSASVAANQVLCHLKTEVKELVACLLWFISWCSFLDLKCIYWWNFNDEVKEKFPKFLCWSPNMILGPMLHAPVHSTHKLLVGSYRWGACIFSKVTSPFPFNHRIISKWIRCGTHYVDLKNIIYNEKLCVLKNIMYNEKLCVLKNIIYNEKLCVLKNIIYNEKLCIIM